MSWRAQNLNKLYEKSCCVCSSSFVGRRDNQNICHVCVPREKRWWLLWQRYGLTKIYWDQLFEQQSGLCAICRLKPATHVDHKHVPGFAHRDDRTMPRLERVKFIRGILCLDCNARLQPVEDVGWLEKAQAYVQAFDQKEKR